MEALNVREEVRNFVNAAKMLTAAEVAEILGTNVNKINVFRGCGLLKGIQTGKQWLFPKASVMEFQRVMLGADLRNVEAVERFIDEHPELVG